MNLSRRSFIKTTGLGTLGLLFTEKMLHAEDAPFVPLRGNLYTYNKSGGTIVLYQSKHALVVVDSQFPDNVSSFIPRLNLTESRNIDILINTHHHGDHTGGNQILGPFAKQIVAHKRVPELLKEIATSSNKEAGIIPTTTYETEWKQDLGDELLHAYHFGPAHTGGDSVVYFEKSGVAHMGDLVFNHAHPFIDPKAGASIKNWISYLTKTTEKLPKDTVYVFGHASSDYGNNGTIETVQFFRDYLSALMNKAVDAVQKGISKDDFISNSVLEGFEHVGTVSPRLNLAFVLGIAWDEANSN